MTTPQAESAGTQQAATEPSPRASLFRKVAVTACVGIVLVVYARSALSYEKTIDPVPRRTGPATADMPEPHFH
ncbi:MAG: hypothetical protein ACRDG9_13190, partial [Actinomycetota bacterium]